MNKRNKLTNWQKLSNALLRIVMPRFFIKRIYPSQSLPTYPYKIGEEWIGRGHVKSVKKLIGNYVIVVFQNGA